MQPLHLRPPQASALRFPVSGDEATAGAHGESSRCRVRLVPGFLMGLLSSVLVVSTEVCAIEVIPGASMKQSKRQNLLNLNRKDQPLLMLLSSVITPFLS